jgi:2'-5' RNA ligase
MRTFIAIELPQEIKSALSNIQAELKQAHADVKWVKPENIHLTLKFLGEIDETLVEKICAILEDIARQNTPFNLSLSDLGAFPKLNYPRVIWIGVTNDQPVVKIAEEIEKEAVEIGLPSESRPFSSHITVGRVRSGLNRGALIEKLNFLKKNFPPSKLEFKVHSLTLFKSTLTPSGPIYEALSTYPLQSGDGSL